MLSPQWTITSLGPMTASTDLRLVLFLRRVHVANRHDLQIRDQLPIHRIPIGLVGVGANDLNPLVRSENAGQITGQADLDGTRVGRAAADEKPGQVRFAM